MSADNPLIRAEEGIEALALIVARYYRTLVQENVPDELARELVARFQEQQLQQGAARQAAASFGRWLEKQKPKPGRTE